jgi:type I restriction enzyme R subunit
MEPSESKRKLVHLARANRKKPTPGERKVWQYLRAHRYMNLDFTRQKPIGRFIVDFYCKRHMLAIEIDGDSHRSLDSINRDLHKENALNQMGITVIRVTESEVNTNISVLLNQIEAFVRFKGG